MRLGRKGTVPEFHKRTRLSELHRGACLNFGRRGTDGTFSDIYLNYLVGQALIGGKKGNFPSVPISPPFGRETFAWEGLEPMDHTYSWHKSRFLVALLLSGVLSGLAWAQAPKPPSPPPAESPTPAANKPSGPGSGEAGPATKPFEIPPGTIAVLQTSFLIVPTNKNGSCSSYVPDYAKYHSIVELLDTESVGKTTEGGASPAGLPIYSVNTDGRDLVSGQERRLGFTTSGFNPIAGTMQLHSQFGEPGTRITFHGDPSHPFAPSSGIRVWDGSIDIDPKCGTLVRAKSVSDAWPSSGSTLAMSDPASLIPQVQRLLKALGYDPGPADGKTGARTVEAIKEFQRREKLPVDGRVSPTLLKALEARKGQ